MTSTPKQRGNLNFLDQEVIMTEKEKEGCTNKLKEKLKPNEDFETLLNCLGEEPYVELCGYLGPDPDDGFYRLYKDRNPLEYLKVRKDPILHCADISHENGMSGYCKLYVKDCTKVTCVSIKRSCISVREASLLYALFSPLPSSVCEPYKVRIADLNEKRSNQTLSPQEQAELSYLEEKVKRCA